MECWSKERAHTLLNEGYWFGSLPSAMSQSILAGSEIRHFGRSSVLYRIGDPVDGLYALLEGDLRVQAFGDDGQRILLRLLGPTSWIGEFQLLDGYPSRTFELSAVSDCWLLFLPKDAFRAIADETPEYYREFVKLLCVHQRFLVRVAVEARSDASRRAARAFIRIAKMHGQPAQDGRVRLPIALSQSDLASLIGVSRQYANELIARWNDQGLLTWKGSSAPVVHVDRLKELLTPLDDWMLESEGWA